MGKTNPLKHFPTPNVDHALRLIERDPAPILRELREGLTDFSARNPEITMQEALVGRQFVSAVADRAHNVLIMSDATQTFEANWQMARLLHNTGKTKDALVYAEEAQRLVPRGDTLLAAKVAERRLNILLDLHQETPNNGYNWEALRVANLLSQLESPSDSPRVAALIAETQQKTERLPTDPEETAGYKFVYVG